MDADAHCGWHVHLAKSYGIMTALSAGIHIDALRDLDVYPLLSLAAAVKRGDAHSIPAWILRISQRAFDRDHGIKKAELERRRNALMASELARKKSELARRRLEEEEALLVKKKKADLIKTGLPATQITDFVPLERNGHVWHVFAPDDGAEQESQEIEPGCIFDPYPIGRYA